MELDAKTGVTTFYTHSDKYGLQITRTSNPDVIKKLSGLTGKKEEHWRKVLDKDGKPTNTKLPKIKNTKWTDEDGLEHGNDKEYVPLDKPVHELLKESDETTKEVINAEVIDVR